MPSCLVLDARMPGQSGWELLAELAARQIDLPVIVISAEVRHQAHAMGAVGFFRKPVDGAALLDAIAWALRSSAPGGNHFGGVSGNRP
jgi:FixJ family two-component response regulator